MQIDNSFVTIIINYLKDTGLKNKDSFEIMFEELSNLTSYQKMIDFYSWAFTADEYKSALRSAFDNIEFKSENEMAMMLFNNLKRIDDLEILDKKIDVFNTYNFIQSTSRLKDTLPSSTNSDMIVYFTFDGINTGSIIDENELMINFMIWPSNENNIKSMEGILLHEYHHIGMKEILKNRGYLTTVKENKDVIRKIAISIVTEGIATYLFNQGTRLFELLIESHGEDFANSYKKSISLEKHDLSKLIKKFNGDMLFISECKNREDALKYIDEYCFSYNGGEPIDKSLGVHICSTIDRELGRDKMIELLINPFGLIEQYNDLVVITEKINCQFFV